MTISTQKCVLFFLLSSFCCQETLSQNSTLKPVASNDTGNGYVHTRTTVDDAICKLIPTVLDIRDEIGNLANAGYKLVKLKIQIKGTNITQRNIYSTSGYHPREWVIATSTTGKSMLMLREYFEPMSMYTLGYGVASLDIILSQYPSNCLDTIHTSQIETLMRGSILNNFESDTSLPESAEVCNQHIVSNEPGMAKLVYVCCKRDLNQEGTVQCRENTETFWITMLFLSLLLIQGVTVAYCPLLLPDTLFKARTVFQKYKFKAESKPLVLNVKVVDSTTPISKSFVKTRLHTFTHLSEFRDHLDQMTTGKAYTMYVNGVDMSIRGSKLTADGSAPFGLMNFIYQFFNRCGLRQEIPSVTACCNARIFTVFLSRIKIRWYQCLRIFMLLLSVLVCVSPWILRVWFYYVYEQDVIQYKEELYKSLNLSMPFNGFVVSYLSPSHPLFIIIYVLLGLEVVFYLPQTDTIKRKLKFTIRKCFRDMRASSKMEACGYFMSKLLYPLTRFGIVGCLIAPLCVIILPFLLLLLAVDALPIVNLTLRLVLNLVYYTLRLISPQTFSFASENDNGKCERWINNRLAAILVTDFQEHNTRINQLIHVSSLIMTLVSIWCILIITVDCISFYVECIVYGLVGFILNPSDTMKYVSLVLLFVVYGVECFCGVNRRYITYGKAINTKVQTMLDERLKIVASQHAKEQVNAAFRLEGNENTEPMYLVAGTERYLKWQAHRLVLFLDSSDIPFIPKSFLRQMGKLQHPVCPGKVHILYMKAFLDFSYIVLFLFFVFIVIFAFGQANDISSGGQAVAALGSGFLPLVLRKFLFQSHAGPSVDTSNMAWQYLFEDAVHKYKDRWNFEDLHVAHFEKAELQKCSVAGTTDAIEVDEDMTSSDMALLSNYHMRNIDVHLIAKRVRSHIFEFYVPRTRAAECEDAELFNEDTVKETIV